MSRNKIYVYCLSGILYLLTGSCEYYLGVNQQPEFTDQSVVEGLNIFGLLRPDNKEDYNKSFVYVQKMWPVLEMDSFTIIHNVDVRVEHLVNDTAVESINLPLVPSDSLFTDTLYRPLNAFIPQPGEYYRMVCRYEGLGDAIGETIFPSQPRIIENSLLVNGREIAFSIASDSLIKMIDIYLVGTNTSQLLTRIVPTNFSDTDVELVLPVDPDGMELKIFGYDTNLAAYYGNSNTSLNFNKYRTTISTLDSGYGVFGSLNFTSIELK